MKCPGCDRDLRVDERAQRMTVGGQKVTIPSYCDTCCRSNTPTPGSKAALERLLTGEVDPAEAERVRLATPSVYDGPPAA